MCSYVAMCFKKSSFDLLLRITPFYFFKKRQKSKEFSYFCAAFKRDLLQNGNKYLI